MSTYKFYHSQRVISEFSEFLGVHIVIVGEDIISLYIWEEGLIDEEGTC